MSVRRFQDDGQLPGHYRGIPGDFILTLVVMVLLVDDSVLIVLQLVVLHCVGRITPLRRFSAPKTNKPGRRRMARL